MFVFSCPLHEVKIVKKLKSNIVFNAINIIFTVGRVGGLGK